MLYPIPHITQHAQSHKIHFRTCINRGGKHTSICTMHTYTTYSVVISVVLLLYILCYALKQGGGGGGGPDIICGPCAIYVNDNGVLPYLPRSSTPVIFSPYKNIPPNFFGTCDAFSGSLRGVCTRYDSQLISVMLRLYLSVTFSLCLLQIICYTCYR